jgi:iron(III) transport system permease protein
MRPDRKPIPTILNALWVAVHVGVLGGVLVVPVYALWRAGAALVEGAGGNSLAQTVVIARWLPLLGTTALVATIAVVIALVLGAVGGLLLGRTDLWGRRGLTLAMVLVACVPVYVWLVFVYAAIPLWELGGSVWICGVLYGLSCVPLAALVLMGAYRGVHPQYEDQVRLEASAWRVMRRVTVPQAMWAYGVVAAYVCFVVGTDFTIADVLLVNTFAREVYTQYALQGSAVGPVVTGLPMFVGLGGLLLVLRWVARGMGRDDTARTGERPRLVELGRGVWLVWPGVLVAVAAAGWCVWRLLVEIGSVGGFWTAAVALRGSVTYSIVAALAGAVLVVAVSPGLAWGLTRRGWLRWCIGAVLVLLLATPAPVSGISLIGLLNRPGWAGAVYDSPACVVLGYVVRFLPIGVLLLLVGVRRVARELEDAARVDGGMWWDLQRAVYWPALRREVVIAFLVVAMLCYGEVATSVLLVPPGWTTASVRAFTLIHFTIYRELATLGLLAALAVTVPAGGLLLALRARADGGEGPERRGF